MTRPPNPHQTRSSYLEIAALQLATTSPTVAAILQSEITHLNIAQGHHESKSGRASNACQSCGFSMLPSLLKAETRNPIVKVRSKGKGTGPPVLIRTCTKCGTKTRRRIPERDDGTRDSRDGKIIKVSVASAGSRAASQAQISSSAGIANPLATTGRPFSKKAKSLRAQLAQASKVARANTAASSNPPLGLMDFLKKA